MVEIVDIEFLCPRWLSSRLNATSEHWENFKNFQVMRRVRQALELVRQSREFSVSHPVIAMFLAVVAVFGFLPILAFLSIVSGSFVVIFMTAFTVFQGVIVISLMPLLTVLVPILMIGGAAAVFTYTAYLTVVKTLQIIKRTTRRLKEMVQSKVPSRFRGKPVRFVGYKMKPRTSQQFHHHFDAFPPNDEEPFEEELLYSSSD